MPEGKVGHLACVPLLVAENAELRLERDALARQLKLAQEIQSISAQHACERASAEKRLEALELDNAELRAKEARSALVEERLAASEARVKQLEAENLELQKCKGVARVRAAAAQKLEAENLELRLRCDQLVREACGGYTYHYLQHLADEPAASRGARRAGPYAG